MEFLKEEHWLFKCIYLIGLASLSIHFYYSFFLPEESSKPFTFIGFSIYSLFFFRMFWVTHKKKY